MQSAIRVLVCADDLLGRAGLAAMLGAFSEIDIVGLEDASLLAGGESADEGQRGDLVVWDMGWSEPRDDLDLGALGAPVLALVADEDQAAVAWRAGCRGLLWRTTPEEDLVAAVLAVGVGFVVVAPGLSSSIARPYSPESSTPTDDLTNREVEVLELVAQGLTNKAIGRQLAISEHTVKFHLNAIMAKLDAQSRTEAVVIATRQGLISL